MKQNLFRAISSALAIIGILSISSARAAAAPRSGDPVFASGGHSEISARALRDFRKQFKEVNNEIWEVIPDGFLSSFIRDGVTNRIYYNKAGKWEFTVRQAEESLLPRALKAALRSVYYDYTISCVHEIRSTSNLSYVVIVEDKKTVKKIGISGDREFEVMEELIKE